MKKLSFALLLSISLFSCDKQEKDLNTIESLYDDMVEMSESVDCTDGTDWRYTAYGHKACGGPVGYIAYNSNIDTTAFLDLVEEHYDLQKAYNEEHGGISTCDIAVEPSGVTCLDGKPVFIYNQ